MKIYKLYETVLNENNVSSCVKAFGSELFGDQLGGNEPNTPIERNYADEIKDFTDNMYGESTTPEFIKALQHLKSCIGQYPEVLIPENITVFRGTMIPIKYFIVNKQKINFEGKNNYTYKANSQIQSWSIAYENAANFGSYDDLIWFSDKFDYDDTTDKGLIDLLNLIISKDIRLPFILAHITNEQEFIFKSEHFRKLSKMPDENEIIRFTNQPVQVVAYLNDEQTENINKKTLKLLSDINKAISLS